jgi:PAS domain S-box-containing protein
VIAPPGGFFALPAGDGVGLAVFAAMGAFISGLAGLYRRARSRVATLDKAAALREAEERFRLREAEVLRRYEVVAGHSRDIILFMSRVDGRILEANAAATAAYGYGREELLGMGIRDLRAPGTLEMVAGQMADADDKGVLFETLHRRRDGRTFPVEVSSQGATVGGERALVSVIRDITERKAAERVLRDSEALYRSLFTLAPGGVIMTDEGGRILAFNDRAAAQLGYDREEFARLSLADIEAGDAPDEAEGRTLRALAGGVEHFEARHRTRQGELRDVLVRSRTLEVEGQRRILWVLADITEQKETERRLRESDQQKAGFLAVLSHELRNPLGPMRTSLQVLEEAVPESERAARAREVIRRQTDHLAHLVDDLLDATRVSQGKVVLQRDRLDLGEVVRRTCHDHRLLFEERHVELRTELPGAPLWVDGDPTRLAQLVGNLLQNAAKFTGPAGCAVVGVSGADGSARLRVRDDGRGIEAGLLGRLFEPFVQGERGAMGGLGLGLALVKSVAELHGGTVRAESDGPGRGSEFVVSLPLAPGPPLPAAEPRPARHGPSRLVLVIDDNRDARESLAALLELRGHQVHLAPDGRAGIEQARQLRPDLVLCDLGLPDMDGCEVARTLRGDGHLRATTLVALSGYAQPADRRRAAAAGFDRHLAKPASLDQLGELLAAERPAGASPEAPPPGPA